MPLKNLLTFLFCWCCVFANAQDTTNLRRASNDWNETHLAFVAGYNGLGYQYAEVGLAYCERGISDRQPFATTFSATCEMRLDNPNRFAPKASVWLAQNGGVFGLNLLYYTGNDAHGKQRGSFCFRPETGIGFSQFKLTYGYNFALSNKNFNGFNRHCLNLSFVLRAIKMKDTRQ